MKTSSDDRVNGWDQGGFWIDDFQARKVSEIPVDEVYKLLGTSAEGLTIPEAKKRIEKYGPNVLIEKARISPLWRFISRLKDLFSLLLVFAAVLSAVAGLVQLTLIILIIVLVNSLFSLFQEWRAEKAMETLRSWMPELTKVLRNGELHRVLVRDITVGDVIVLEEGDRVPADARLVESFDLWTNNVPLTGESTPQPRTTEPAKVEYGSFLEAPNIVFMSTSVAKGRGKAVIYATGMNTKFGEIATLTQEIKEEESPLQKEIAYAAKYDFVLAVSVGAVFFFIASLWLHLAIFDSLLFMIGVMVACVPEGLQVTVSSSLVINVLRMAKENVLVKRLSSVQTLGSVTVICTDKTGTITKGEITVTKIWFFDKLIEVSGAGYEPLGNFTHEGKSLGESEVLELEKLLEIGAFCNTSRVKPPIDEDESWNIIGDPTDGACLVAALKYGLNIESALANRPLVDMIPFDSVRKRMTTIHRDGDRVVAYTKGAPRSVLSVSTNILIGGRVKELDQEHLGLIEKKILEFGEEGLRVIAVAFRELTSPPPYSEEKVERGLVLVGLLGMKDPPRPEVKEAVRLAKKAGTKIIIVTGDYGPTAKAIAKEVGIVESDESRIIRGVDLDKMSDEELSAALDQPEVTFARVSPEQKLRIVHALKRKGDVVSVTGDGANDAPSLKEADVGVAMGLSGTDVAREAADIVLLDDSFASIVKAVEAGRTIYDNIRKFITYVFSHNWAELIPYILYALTEIPLPLLVVQVLAIDLGIDVLPSLALSREPPEPGIMERPPRSRSERLFNANVLLRSLYVGAITAGGAMVGCISAWSSGGWVMGMHLEPSSRVFIKGTTMTFAGIVAAQMGNVLACRTSKASLFKTSWTSNKWIWIGILGQISMLSAIIYLPPLQAAFGTTALGISDWIFLAALACTVVLAEELRKLLSRRLTP
nr:cation-transporting P-type ATPase [Candidatus Njordarchaeum guaymaensis]